MHKEIQSLEQSEIFFVASTILCCAVFGSRGVGGNIGSFLHSDYQPLVYGARKKKIALKKLFNIEPVGGKWLSEGAYIRYG